MLRDGKVKEFTFENPIPFTVYKERPLGARAPLSKRDKKRYSEGLIFFKRADRSLAETVRPSLRRGVNLSVCLSVCSTLYCGLFRSSPPPNVTPVPKPWRNSI